ncbi:dehydrogenase/reductase SDR family member 11-like isoform X2 [Bacillus rossius redtenbacheri]|uniref:dehydrogenase/reductase SDR family member 11-like isoform X2 n=1 Tax=Bacillus rossius redtenbacheri TaxID=93214 RepID=UPI002FDD7124
MERWSGRVAVVTGASAGIGAAIAQLLVKRGLRVVGLARRADNIQALADSLKDAPGKLYAVKADLSKEEDIMVAFQWVKDNLGGVDLLVNNAAVAHNNNLADGKTEQWRQLLEVNLLALSICTREALQSMKERSVDDGHIVHINSVAGHSVVDFPGIAFYSATKHGVTALTEGLRKELACLKSGIRVTVTGMHDAGGSMRGRRARILSVFPEHQPRSCGHRHAEGCHHA